MALVLTVAVGTGSLFLFHGFNNGIMNRYRDNTIHARFGHGQIQTKGYGERVYERPWEHWIEHPDSLQRELLAVDGVRQVFPRAEFPALRSSGRITVSGKGQGVDGPGESRFFNTLNFIAGNNLSGEPASIVVGMGLARGLDVGVGDLVTVTARGREGRDVPVGSRGNGRRPCRAQGIRRYRLLHSAEGGADPAGDRWWSACLRVTRMGIAEALRAS